MARYGLLGERLGHSYSPMLHGLLADYEYGLYPMPPEAVEDFLRHGDWQGLNVTIPYKIRAMACCQSLSPEAERVGCVNSLLRLPGGGIHGHNTDYAGFAYMAKRAGLDFRGKRVVVLGSGGASLCAQAVARDRGAAGVAVISRRGADNYENLKARHGDCHILINATPVGTSPRCCESPVSLDGFSELAGVLDVVYNPLRTRLVMEARERGVRALGGLSMLAAQARAAAELFTGRDIPEERLEAALAKLGQGVENMVLVGMPGCGKSTIGQALAAATGRELVDTDALVEAKAGRSIPQIFADAGEAAFRRLEAEALEEAAWGHGRVIATGGGAVLREENRRALRQNGRVYFLERELSKLPKGGRPLSKDLEAMYERRLPLYRLASDRTVDNNGDKTRTVNMILEDFYAHPCD